MTEKQELLKLSITKFTRFGSKSFSMDQLAAEMGISKKTIYDHFSNKEELVLESLKYLLDKIRLEMDQLEQSEGNNPLKCILGIYRIGLDTLRPFDPVYLHGLRKYYPEAFSLFESFRNAVVFTRVYGHLEQAQALQQIRKDVDIRLVCTLYMMRIEEVIFSRYNNLFDTYSNQTLLDHLIRFNLRGFMTPAYASTSDI